MTFKGDRTMEKLTYPELCRLKRMIDKDTEELLKLPQNNKLVEKLIKANNTLWNKINELSDKILKRR